MWVTDHTERTRKNRQQNQWKGNSCQEMDSISRSAYSHRYRLHQTSNRNPVGTSPVYRLCHWILRTNKRLHKWCEVQMDLRIGMGCRRVFEKQTGRTSEQTKKIHCRRTNRSCFHVFQYVGDCRRKLFQDFPSACQRIQKTWNSLYAGHAEWRQRNCMVSGRLSAGPRDKIPVDGRTPLQIAGSV